MFRKLRNKFLLINMITFSAMMFFALATIYSVNYRNIFLEIEKELLMVSSFIDRGDFKPPKPPMREFQRFNRRIIYSILTTHTGEINEIVNTGWQEQSIEFFESAKEIILKDKKDFIKFNLSDGKWLATKKMYHDEIQINFTDISNETNILRNMLYILIFVGLAMFFIIFFISYYFAIRAIEPIKLSFLKQKEFIADASHELKTPMALINTNIDVLLQNKDDKICSQIKWLEYTKSEINRITNLTNDLLFLAQIDEEENAVSEKSTEFNLSETIEYVTLTMEAVIFERKIKFETDIEENIYMIGNKEQIKQVIMILLDNAIKYCINDKKIKVTLKKSKTIKISVENSSKGLDKENLEKIFDRFYRMDKSRTRETGGHGLGLSIAKTIIENHKGKIYAQSTLNKNITFIIEV